MEEDNQQDQNKPVCNLSPLHSGGMPFFISLFLVLTHLLESP